jgi:hypothetical protein
MGRLLLATLLSYLSVVWLIEIGLLQPTRALETATAGIRHVGYPLLAYGAQLGVEEALLIFLSNLLVAVLLVSALSLAAHGVPRRISSRFPRLVRKAWHSSHMDVLRLVPGCCDISDPQLRLTYFCLFVIPMVSMVFFGVMIGCMLASGQYVFGSLATVLALVVPHGILEVPMIVLAAAIPFSAYLLVQKGVASSLPNGVLHEINRFRSCYPLQICLIVVISLLWVAGVVEVIYTP